MLKLDHVTKKFGGLIAVNDVSINIEKGRLAGLIGPNGAGKTTIFNIITGVYRPENGRVYFKDREITGEKPHRITSLGVARTFQNIKLFYRMTVLDNVRVACHFRLKASILSAVFDLPGYSKQEKSITEESLKLLEAVGLYELRNERASSLPYGHQRKLEIARALATRPELLLLDEPAAGMNPEETLDLMKFIVRIRNEFDLTILLIEHDMKVVMGICEEITVLDHGNIIARGTPLEIQNNPEVIKAYLGSGAYARG
ncbi:MULTISPECIES: ABC transporter ATP-binding protein [Pseudothermotoga]|uniref:ABC transporter related n=1 Tax=Pseudothermotoga lettingae (strain ATCC BAA-301 / DSM 14385 / NBRC 107922 / TMO) TaxID=416591 RepID=A8F8K8_PSELT|nr:MULTISPECIES: ABC transporter ATP-binding protein [Pseudothermotoga]ABV34492.1 ABC transporter related [Pseudothermotoga lettingae TMO]GLI48562.1 ABC transporter ATP-binding protein [Pseudothermotoga lettingae TMO]HBJ80930.1 ABC transporter ATP-binding protein [Pseudothermotoga sp.]